MSWYISYYYDDSPYAAYAKQKADISNRYDFKTLRAQSLAAWRATYGGELSSEQQKQLDSYFNLISDNSFVYFSSLAPISVIVSDNSVNCFIHL